MIQNSIQWFRYVYLHEIKVLPPLKDEQSWLNCVKRARYILPNPHHYPYICFPCGEFHDDIAKHEGTWKHMRNEKRWQKEMGQMYWGPDKPSSKRRKK